MIYEIIRCRYCQSEDLRKNRKYLPSDKHVISKGETQRIENKNLTLRTRFKRLMRKIICFPSPRNYTTASLGCS